MATIETIYQGQLRSEATHLQSGTKIVTDAPVDNHGKGESFSPTDMVAAALGSCMLTIMGIAAEARGIDISGTKLSITKIMAADPRRISEIKIEFRFPADYDAKFRRILENAAETCPVAKSLHPDLKQTISFVYAK
ncbi:MAG: OsmC family protein [Rikenellaceae bacterium]|nr:OsmC family protein [Rikenellaceae bacterium]